MLKLQNLLKPNESNHSVERMYLSIHGGVFVDDKILLRKKLSYLSLDSYYNAFSTKIWKDECGLDRVSFHASGKGLVQLKIILLTIDGMHVLLSNKKVELNNEVRMLLDIDLSTYSNGLIFPQFIALENDVEIHDGYWSTEQKPINTVKIGISITHFNRNKQVSMALKKLSSELIDKEENSNKFQLIVVDNSSNISEKESHGQKIIPSENLGGSGGFMRGLIYYQENTDVTHVLFMDDDASCETECIERTWAMLSFVKDDNSAIVGSLIYENTPTVLHEKGAFFSLTCHSNFCGVNLLEPLDLVRIDLLPIQTNYGGWWYFAFPIQKVKHFSLPFFVRGDDILFSMSNDFKFISPLGITSYSDSFISKESPLTMYLDTRYHLLNTILNKKKSNNVRKVYKFFHKKNFLFYRYEHIEAIRLALKDVFSGVDFWEKNIDAKEVRHKINSIVKLEKSVDINLSNLNNLVFEAPYLHLSRFKRVMKFLSLNGILIPKKNKIVFQEKGKESYLMTYKYKKILTMDSLNGKGYITKFNLFKSIKYKFLYFYDILCIYMNFSRIQKHYKENLYKITSKEFWIKNLKLKNK